MSIRRCNNMAKINANYEEAQTLLDTLETMSSEDVLNLGTVNLVKQIH